MSKQFKPIFSYFLNLKLKKKPKSVEDYFV